MTAPGSLADGATVLPPDHSPRVLQTYLIGVYLGINAIRDAYLLVEAPDCVHMKTQFVQGNHDWLSTLTSVSGHHRVANTALHPVHMTASRESTLHAFLLRMAQHESVAGLVLTSMPMAYITGADYERKCEEVADATGKPVVHVKCRSLGGDWLGGYAELLLSLAKSLDLEGGQPEPDRVGIVGHLFERNEGDGRANVAELRRLLRALELEPTGVWLDGGDFASLSAIKDAGTLVSMPYGRRAAKRVARRTGANLVECDLPLGPLATADWLRRIAAATGREQAAEALIAREAATLGPAVEIARERGTAGEAWVFVGDPVLAPRIGEVARWVGARLERVVLTNLASYGRGLRAALGPDTELLLNPRQTTLSRLLSDLSTNSQVDRVLTHSDGRLADGVPTVDLGFPSFYRHHLSPRPTLGYRGALALLDDLADPSGPAEAPDPDWLGSYAAALRAQADRVDLEGGSPQADKVAVIGALYHEDRADCRADLAELCVLTRALGLEPVSVWPSGAALADLEAARDAGVVLSLPYGRAAAARVAERVGARLIELDLPLGLEATERWLRRVGAELGRSEAAERYLDEQLASLVPALEWLVPFHFQGQRWAVAADPYIAAGLSELARLLGARVEVALIGAGVAARLPDVARARLAIGAEADQRWLDSALAGSCVSTVFATSDVVVAPEHAVVRVGCPTAGARDAPLYDRPILGFAGCLSLVDRIINATSARQLRHAASLRDPLGRSAPALITAPSR